MSSPSPLHYCPDLFRYSRRPTREVMLGELGIGGRNPLRVQSMITSDTRDTAACVAEILALADAGCEIVRITAQTKTYAANLQHIAHAVRSAGCRVPLVADIHFKPDAAMEAVKWVEKIRINPGNFSDQKKSVIRDYDAARYERELARIRVEFSPLVLRCKELARAMRIGTNHGSLSDRIMNRYGDTPLGMVESALEFARIARDLDYHQLVFSMKASNPKVMIEAYRLLVARLAAEGPDWNYPLHLGVTEAGDGEDGRIKSAIGIGSLLADGIGDTIRVSLTEDSIHEIPVARALAAPYDARGGDDGGGTPPQAVASCGVSSHISSYDPFTYERRKSSVISVMGHDVGGESTVRVFTTAERWDAIAHKIPAMGDFKPEAILEKSGILELDPRDDAAMAGLHAAPRPQLISVADGIDMEVIHAFRLLAARAEPRHPILLKDSLRSSCGFQPQSTIGLQPQLNHDCQQRFLNPGQPIQKSHAGFEGPRIEDLRLEAAATAAATAASATLTAASNLGSLLCDGIGDAILVRSEPAPGASLRLAYNILQAAGTRIFKTDYVACPSCGRTLFNLQHTTQKVRAATGHLKGVRIAIMGCIVNGPGEMADADFGYVGGAPGKINLYVGKTAVQFNIPESEAVDRLIALIAEHGKWLEPPPASPAP